jgi:hypothetical protein
MPAPRYRLGRDTRAVQCEDGAKGFVLIPEGALLTVDSLDAAGRLVKVVWGSQVLLMFWQDLLERAAVVEEAPPRAARVASHLP